MTYKAVLADCGPYRGEWIVIREFDGALWSEGFIIKSDAERYADFLNGI